MKREHLEDYVLTIPDFPQKGIMFRDITSLVQDPDGLQDAVDGLIRALEGVDFDVVLGLESRGFIFGTAIAYAMVKGLVTVRKKGKLTATFEYSAATLANREPTVDSIIWSGFFASHGSSMIRRRTTRSGSIIP